MSQTDVDHWDERYRAGGGPQGKGADRRLARHAAYVDARLAAVAARGETPLALDIACGAGGTLIWLARRGWHVVGVDASGEALELASNAVQTAGYTKQCRLIQADLDHWRPSPASVDLVTCFFFLDRVLLPALRDAVRPGGLLILETFNRHRLANHPQSNPKRLLAGGELEALIDKWNWFMLATLTDGPDVERPTSAIVAQRPIPIRQERAPSLPLSDHCSQSGRNASIPTFTQP